MFQKYLDMPNDSREKTIFVATALCLVCSILVSGAAVALKSTQEANKALDMRKNIVQIGGLQDPSKSIDEIFEGIETKIIDLDSGEYTDEVDPESYDIKSAAKDPALSEVLAADQDLASIKRRPKYAPVYLVKNGDQVERVILPIYGYGLWSTLYGFIALEGDINTVLGLGFYEHGETPGLGGEVDNPKWKAIWPSKQVFDADGNIAIKIVKGGVDPSRATAVHEVDALAGATLTSQGVENLVRFWLGNLGYEKYLQKLRDGSA